MLWCDSRKDVRLGTGAKGDCRSPITCEAFDGSGSWAAAFGSRGLGHIVSGSQTLVVPVEWSSRTLVA